MKWRKIKENIKGVGIAIIIWLALLYVLFFVRKERKSVTVKVEGDDISEKDHNDAERIRDDIDILRSELGTKRKSKSL